MKQIGLIISGVALLFLLTACPASNTPELPGPPETPTPTTTAISTISGKLDGWTRGEAFITLTGGYAVDGDSEGETLTMSEPNYTGALKTDGTFAVAIAEKPVETSLLQPMGCKADTPNFAVLALGLVSSTGVIDSPDDAIADVTLRPGQATFPQVMWIYVDKDYSYKGPCDSTQSLLSLGEVDVDFVKGWNAVFFERITFGARMSTLTATDDYRWLTQF